MIDLVSTAKTSLVLALFKGKENPSRIEKTKVSESLGISVTYLNQLISKDNSKYPSVSLLNKMSEALSWPNEVYDELVQLKEQVRTVKVIKKAEKLTEELSPSVLDEYITKGRVSRSEAVRLIMKKITENPDHMQRYMEKGFHGFDNISTSQVQTFFNRYYLSNDTDDSILVVEPRDISRESAIRILLEANMTYLTSLSDDQLKNLISAKLDLWVNVVEEKKEEVGKPILTVEKNKLPEEAPAEDIGGESLISDGEDDEDSRLDDKDIEEESDDYQTDDVAWVSPETPFIKSLKELEKHNKIIEESAAKTGPKNRKKDVTSALNTKARKMRFEKAERSFHQST